MTARLSSALPADAVTISTDAATRPFWEAAKRRQLVACRCASCQAFRMPPTPYCPECRSTDVDWPELSGRGRVYSYAIVHGYPGVSDITLVPVVVELEDAPGVKIVSNVVGIDPEDVHIDMELIVDFHPIADDWMLPIFRPANDQREGDHD